MTSFPRLLSLATCLLLALAGAGRADETVVTFQRSVQRAVHRPSSAGGGVRVDTLSSQVLLCLGDRRLVVRDPQREWLYDFDRRRVRIVDPGTMTYADWSLFGMVAFNDAELAERLAQGAAQAASVRELEALFSMTSAAKPRRAETLVDSSRGDRVDVRINGRPFTTADLSPHTLRPEQAVAFERFLLFQCHLHPVARRALVRSQRLPANLTFRTIDGPEESIVTLRLVKVGATPEVNDPTRGLPRRDITDSSYDVLGLRIDGARAMSADTSRARRSVVMRAFEAEAAGDGRLLDVALSRLARAMESCEKPSLALWPRGADGKAAPDSVFRACVAAADSLGPARVRRVLATLAKVDPTIATASVVGLQMGRAQLAAGDLETGVRQVLQGLEVHPCAVGAWVDLGMAFRRGNQPVLAWLCFDTARAVAPAGCHALGALDRVEADLMKRRPEYFH